MFVFAKHISFYFFISNSLYLLTYHILNLSLGYMGTPGMMGKVKNITDFDAEFFGVHSKGAHTMDPMLRNMLEVVYEAIVDAGNESFIEEIEEYF